MLSPVRFFTNKRYVSLWRLMRFSQRPIMICGCGRSGTTLLLSIMSAHPSIHAIDFETKIFTKRPFASVWLNHLNHLAKIWLIVIGRPVKKSATRWLEKNPRNIEWLPEILDEFGSNIQVINIVRDGRDVITSMHPETSAKGYHVEPERWIDAVSMAQKFEGHKDVITIKYEDLVGDLGATTKKVFDFLDLPIVDLSDFHESSQVKKHRAWSGTLQPLHNDSVRKWERPEFKDRISNFMENRAAADLLQHFGYK